MSAPPAFPEEFRDLADHLEVCRVLGGGEGWSARVRDRSGRDLFVKILPPGTPLLEGSLLASLDHAAIPRVLEVGSTAAGHPYLLRAWHEGTPLGERLPLSTGEAVVLAESALEVLAFVHARGVLHLDLKPGNLLFDPRAEPPCVLLDFGLGRRGEARHTGGTLFHAAPEQLLGAPATARSDLFALGTVLFLALRGPRAVPLRRFLDRFPQSDFFTACGADPRTLPSPFDVLIPRLVARRPEQRPADAQEALEMLGRGTGRPSPALLRPDPVTVWHDVLEAAVAAAGDHDVELHGDDPGPRASLAVHLAGRLGGVRRFEQSASATRLVRDAAGVHRVGLPALTTEHTAAHLQRVLGLSGTAAHRAATWLGREDNEDTRTLTGLTRALQDLVERGAIVRHGTGWRWPDAATGRLTRASLPPATAEGIHEAARRGRIETAQHLYRSAVGAAPGDDRTLRAALAGGLLEAGEPVRALPWCGDLPLLRARALFDAGRVHEAARALASEPDPWPWRTRDARRLAAEVAAATGDAGEAERRLEALATEGLEAAEQVALTPVLAALGKTDAAREQAEAAYRARATLPPFTAAAAANNLAVQCRAAGDAERATALHEEAVEAFRALGHVRHAATAILNLGVLAKDRGDFTRAREHLREARTFYASVGDAVGEALAEAALGSAALARGDHEPARDALERAAAELARHGAREHLPLVRVMAARAHAQLGAVTRARELLEAVGDVADARVRREAEEVRALMEAAAPAVGEDAPAPATAPSPPPPTMPPEPAITRERFRTFVAVNRRLAAEADLEQAMRHLLETAITMTGGRRGSLVLATDDGLRLECEAGSGGAQARAFSRSLANRAIQEQRTMTAEDALAEGDLLEMPSVQQLGVRSALCAPFQSAGGAEGAIYVEHAGRQGVFDDDDKEALEILADQAAIAVDRMLHERRLATELDRSKRDLAVARRALRRTPTRLLGDAPAVRSLRARVDKLAATDLSVLILGETGTGKELVARAIHDRGPRARGPFVSENCSALPAELMERELFGHVRGAFTGADEDRPGLLELAAGGTLFLDEVGDMPLTLQAKLLRALQERAIRRLGGSETVPLDLRLVAATHKDLRAMVAEQTFREDLYYRLAGVEVRVPPLRERGRDVLKLAHHFLDEHNREHRTTRRFSEDAERALLAYPWPGNVRELQHVVARAFLLAEGDTLDDLQLPTATPAPESRSSTGWPVLSLREAEERTIAAALESTGGDKTRAAKVLGISRTALYDKLKRMR